MEVKRELLAEVTRRDEVRMKREEEAAVLKDDMLLEECEVEITRRRGPATHEITFEYEARNVEEFFNKTELTIGKKCESVVRNQHSKLLVTARLHFILRDRRTKEEKSYWSGQIKNSKCFQKWNKYVSGEII